MKETCYIIKIGTDKYAGNFERELCAYCTGITGDCDVGEEEAKMFNEKYPKDEAENGMFQNIIQSRPDEHGCWRLVALCYDDTNAIDIYFCEQPSKEEVRVIELRAIEYCKQNDIKIKVFGLYKETKITKCELI